MNKKVLTFALPFRKECGKLIDVMIKDKQHILENMPIVYKNEHVFEYYNER